MNMNVFRANEVHKYGLMSLFSQFPVQISRVARPFLHGGW